MPEPGMVFAMNTVTMLYPVVALMYTLAIQKWSGMTTVIFVGARIAPNEQQTE